MSTIRNETAHSINGARGRLFTLRVPPAPWKAGTFANQKWISERRPIKGFGAGAEMQVEIRFDDECRNGHNTFAITAEVTTPASRRRNDTEAGGCMHEDIAKVFPELAHLIRWHLVSSEGPLHYISNTLYHASDRDHNGLRKGETRQVRNGRTGKPAWDLVAIVNGEQVPLHMLNKHLDADEEPAAPELRYVPWNIIGEGKERNFDHARASACWPEATDAQLAAPREELEAALQARLPALLANFRTDIEAAGFMWEAPAEV